MSTRGLPTNFISTNRMVDIVSLCNKIRKAEEYDAEAKKYDAKAKKHEIKVEEYQAEIDRRLLERNIHSAAKREPRPGSSANLQPPIAEQKSDSRSATGASFKGLVFNTTDILKAARNETVSNQPTNSAPVKLSRHPIKLNSLPFRPTPRLN